MSMKMVSIWYLSRITLSSVSTPFQAKTALFTSFLSLHPANINTIHKTKNRFKISPSLIILPLQSSQSTTFLLWYNNDMNEKESRISKENRLIRKANYELDKENNELKKLVKDLEEENSRQDKVIRKMKEQLIQLMVENAELKRRN